MARPPAGERPLCCGRTFLASGLIDEARAEAERTLSALEPFVKRGVTIVGLEPSCLLTLRDEFSILLSPTRTQALAAKAMLFEEFIASEVTAERWDARAPSTHPTARLLHGHCHQKLLAYGAVKNTRIDP